jgi:hypothetical protein
MKPRSRKQPLEHAFLGGLIGLAAFIILEACLLVTNHGAGQANMGLIGMPALVFGCAAFLNRLRIGAHEPVRVRASRKRKE